jgi:hypothetical protein
MAEFIHDPAVKLSSSLGIKISNPGEEIALESAAQFQLTVYKMISVTKGILDAV